MSQERAQWQMQEGPAEAVALVVLLKLRDNLI